MTKQQQLDQQQAIDQLRAILKPGDTLYTTLRHVSRSGMQRVIDVHVIKDGEPRWIGGLAARATGSRFDDRRQGIVIGGCGMDMGFAIVYDLAYRLFPKGFPVVERCTDCLDVPGKNGLGNPCAKCSGTGKQPARGRNGDMSGWDSDGGYALRQSWL